VALVSAGYYVGAILGILLGFPPSGIASIWFPTAIVLAALLLTPPRYWWMYLLATVPTHLHVVATFQRPEVPLVVMLSQVGTGAVLALLAALAIRIVIGVPPRFDSLRNMAAFIVLAGIGATAVACALAILLFLATGWATDFWLAWRQRVLGHVFAIITIPPVILTFTGQLLGAHHPSWRFYAELGLLTIGLLTVSIPVFAWESPGTGNVPSLLLAPLPFLLWAAVRLGTGGLSFSLLVVAGVALVNAAIGRGPFAVQAPAENVLSLQIFLLAISIPLMLLAALVEERRRAEALLKQTEARMGMAAASTDTGLWQYDVSTGHLWATEHCRFMFGLDADSPLTPNAFLGAIHPDDRAEAIAAMRMARSAGEIQKRGEFRVVDANGKLRWYLATSRTEFDDHGEPIRVSGIFRDVTSRRKAEQEAERLEGALRAARSELARVNRQTTAGQMAASIAHEMNQPLAAIVTNAGAGLRWLEREAPDPSEAQAALRRIIDDGHRAGLVIAGLRAMFGKDSGEKSPVDINDLIREVLALVHGELHSQRVAVQVELHRELPRVMADRAQLQQVFLNLIMNAIEAMSSMQNRERVMVVKSELHGERDVLIAVEDSGPGIDPNDMNRIFDPFFTTKSHGMGLGLSICRSIIDSHDGRLWASTRNPHGSGFYVQLRSGVRSVE
jgi:PAS domain S-box-containing protein